MKAECKQKDGEVMLVTTTTSRRDANLKSAEIHIKMTQRQSVVTLGEF